MLFFVSAVSLKPLKLFEETSYSCKPQEDDVIHKNHNYVLIIFGVISLWFVIVFTDILILLTPKKGRHLFYCRKTFLVNICPYLNQHHLPNRQWRFQQDLAFFSPVNKFTQYWPSFKIYYPNSVERIFSGTDLWTLFNIYSSIWSPFFSDDALVCLFVCLFVCFTSQVNSYGHCGTVSSPNHTFSWPVIRAHTFACNWQQPFLNESAEGGEWP